MVWQGDTVVTLRPFALGAFNDCSIRRPNAPKISHKKNWGPASKGVAREFFEAHDLTPDGPTATLRLLCHLRTADGVHHEYGVDSPLLGYSYYGEVLLDWIVERLANQKGSPDTPLEDVGALLVACGRPENVLIGIGATRYTNSVRPPICSPATRRSCGSTTPTAKWLLNCASWFGRRRASRGRWNLRHRVRPNSYGGAVENGLNDQSIDPFLPNVQSFPSKKTNGLFQGLEILAEFE